MLDCFAGQFQILGRSATTRRPGEERCVPFARPHHRADVSFSPAGKSAGQAARSSAERRTDTCFRSRVLLRRWWRQRKWKPRTFLPGQAERIVDAPRSTSRVGQGAICIGRARLHAAADARRRPRAIGSGFARAAPITVRKHRCCWCTKANANRGGAVVRRSRYVANRIARFHKWIQLLNYTPIARLPPFSG